jgi:hypothetical protein
MPESPAQFKILGREPMLWLGAIAAFLSLGTALGIDGLSAAQVALIVAAINALLGVAGALMVRPIAPEAFTFAIAALAALAAGYGYEASPEVVGAVTAATITLLALITRGEVSPKETTITSA